LHDDADGRRAWTDRFAYVGGAAYPSRRELRGLASERALLIDFIKIVARDGVSALIAHRAFMSIDEYRSMFADAVHG
jgi:hypothetical protein